MPDINGIPYVESTDLVSGWPTVSQSVAQEVSDQLASKLDLAGGKILQIVRATDATARTTTSTSYVDASISVTITPTKNDSAVVLVWSFRVATTSNFAICAITDASNNLLSGAEAWNGGSSDQNGVLVGYSTPATTSATTYKGRFRASTAATIQLQNNLNTAQIYALEISA